MLANAMKLIILAIAVVAVLPAGAQTTPAAPPAPVMETVMSASGDVLTPWVRSRSCSIDAAGKEVCRLVVIHSATREIARVGDTWSSKFAPTGNGSEVKRLESTMDKAVRLASSPKPSAQ